jgi:hypothetical protein
MRKIPGSKGAIAAGLLVAFGCLISQTASADDTTSVNNGFALPGVSLLQGTDEVRAADGTSCRSAVGGSGAYLDMGVIGKPNTDVANNNYYGRVVVPLGRGPKRLDCVKLYELEIERLKLELELAKAGLGRSVDPEIDGTQTTALPEAQEPEPKAAASKEEEAPQVQSSVEPEEAVQVQSSAEPEEAPLVQAEAILTDEDDSEIVVSAAAWGKSSKVSHFVMAGGKPVAKKAVAKEKDLKPAVVKAAAKGIAAKPASRLKIKKTGKAAWADEGWSDEGLNAGGEG